jgi:general secretion pathway protein A
MYASHFGLEAEPFNLAPDPNYLYLGSQYRDAISELHYGLLDCRGFLTLIGEVGTGKTTILHSMLAELPANTEAAFVSYADQPFAVLLSLLLTELGVAHDPASEAAMLSGLNAHLRRRGEEGWTVVFIIDEAQNLGDDTLERLRLLSNIETSDRKLLQIVLVGQPELQHRLHQQHLRQLNERISVRAYLNPLPRREMAAYVAHRMQRGGGDLKKVFTPLARWALLERARGIPRRANILFHNALLFAYGREAKRVTLPIALAAIREMNDHPLRRWRRLVLQNPAPIWATAGVLALALVAGRLWTTFVSGSNQQRAATATATPTPPPSPVTAVPGSGTESTAPAVAAAPPPTMPAPATVEAAATPTTLPANPALPGTAAAGEAITLWVPQGATLSSLARMLYGRPLVGDELQQFIAVVRTMNPQVTDPDRISARQLLRLPAVSDLPKAATEG